MSLRITQCHVYFVDSFPVLTCHHDGARYHVWLDEDRNPRAPLYKNPPQREKPGSAGYFRTRTLSMTSRFGAALIEAMQENMRRDSLYEKALATRTTEEAAAPAEPSAGRQHLVIGVDPNGQVFFVGDEAPFTYDAREAVVFSDTGLAAADALAAHHDLEQQRRGYSLAVLSLSSVTLEALLAEPSPQ